MAGRDGRQLEKILKYCKLKTSILLKVKLEILITVNSCGDYVDGNVNSQSFYYLLMSCCITRLNHIWEALRKEANELTEANASAPLS